MVFAQKARRERSDQRGGLPAPRRKGANRAAPHIVPQISLDTRACVFWLAFPRFRARLPFMVELPPVHRLGYRPAELAALLGYNEETVRLWIRSGILPAEKFGRNLVITCETLRQKNLLPPGWPGGRL